mgnify:CR=1 FL=1
MLPMQQSFPSGQQVHTLSPFPSFLLLAVFFLSSSFAIADSNLIIAFTEARICALVLAGTDAR